MKKSGEHQEPRTSSSCDERSSLEYDILIVGAGPSAVGLLYGLLEPYATTKSPTAEDEDYGVNVKVPPFTIALIERGSDAPNPIFDNPKDWIKASHVSSRSTTIYYSTPQTNLRNRILSIPTGQGLGGTTNINACWVYEPCEDDFDDWPKYYATKITEMENNGKQPRRTNRMMRGIQKMKSVMRENDALVVDSELVLDDVNGTGEVESDVAVERGDIGGEEEHPCGSIFANICEGTDSQGELLAKTLKWKGITNAASKDHQKRVNYFEAILQPLLKQNPHLERVLTIYTGVQVENILTKSQVKTNGCTTIIYIYIIIAVEYHGPSLIKFSVSD